MKDDLKKEVIKCICGEWTKPKVFHIEGFDVRGSECPKCGEAVSSPKPSKYSPQDKYGDYRRKAKRKAQQLSE